MTPRFPNLLFAAACFAAAAAHADIVEIAWNAEGRFEHRAELGPGKFAEACGRLGRGDSVAWRFDAGGALDFNVHYHEGKDVRYPERRDALARGSGRLEVAKEQDYCWMWTNRSTAALPLAVVLERRPAGR